MKIEKLKSRNKSLKYPAVFGVSVLVIAGVFLFGGKARGLVYGKLMARGNFFFNGGAYDLAKAEKYFKIAAFVDGKISTPRYQLARIHFVKNELEKAKDEIETAIGLNPEGSRVYYVSGLINGYLKNYPEAISDFSEFVERSPGEWAGYNDLAWVYFKKGDFENAKTALEKGLEVKPENPWLLNGLGAVLAALNDFSGAEEVLGKARQFAEGLTPGDWKKAYPGNDPSSVDWDIAEFRSNVNFNLRLAFDKKSEGAIMTPACSGSCTYNCTNYGDCIMYYICSDSDHPNGVGGEGYHYFGPAVWTSAGYDPSCCAPPPPPPPEDPPPPPPPPSPPGNQAPRPVIENPADGARDLDTAIGFLATASDPEGDLPMTYTSVIKCNGNNFDQREGEVSDGTITFSLAGLPSGGACQWTISVTDSKNATGTDTHNFFIKVCTPLSNACGPFDGESLCAGRQITREGLCSVGNPTPEPGDLEINSYTVNWTCRGGESCGGDPSVSCSAKGQRTCGWIETNP